MKHLAIAFLLLLIPFFAVAEERDAGFTSSPIDSIVFARMKGKSYKDDCTIPLSELRYLRVLHYDFEGNVCQGELVCNKSISNDLLEIFDALFKARYPIERMVLIDDFDADDERSMTANNTSCFNFRTVAGTNKLSAHSRGMAIDINPLFNPYVKQSRGKTIVSPAAARPYVNRAKSFHYKIDRQDLCYRLFIAHGFQWGGAWRSCKDYQHFEK
jgi:hypothetical protein